MLNPAVILGFERLVLHRDSFTTVKNTVLRNVKSCSLLRI
jgi:hypothetical protein